MLLIELSIKIWLFNKNILFCSSKEFIPPCWINEFWFDDNKGGICKFIFGKLSKGFELLLLILFKI
jgi:hypothetical protein